MFRPPTEKAAKVSLQRALLFQLFQTNVVAELLCIPGICVGQSAFCLQKLATALGGVPRCLSYGDSLFDYRQCAYPGWPAAAIRQTIAKNSESVAAAGTARAIIRAHG
jgi:hypothetical protein